MITKKSSFRLFHHIIKRFMNNKTQQTKLVDQGAQLYQEKGYINLQSNAYLAYLDNWEEKEENKDSFDWTTLTDTYQTLHFADFNFDLLYFLTQFFFGQDD